MTLCILKYTLYISLWFSSTSHAFVVHSFARHNTLMIKSAVTSTAEEAFQKIGIEQEQLAIGVDPREFLDYIGT